jgi:hypothetical protein
LDVGTLGALIAKGLTPEAALTDEATRTGYNAGPAPGGSGARSSRIRGRANWMKCRTARC